MNIGNMKRSETTEQIRLFAWAKQNEAFIPELKLLHHIPNEGKRKQTTGQILKAEGLKSGVPDVCLPVPKNGYSGLYIEMKFGKNKPTKNQEEFMELLRQQGHKVAVCYSAEEARELIRCYLARGEGFNLVNCEEAPKIWNYCEGAPKSQEWAVEICRKCEFYKDNQKKGE